MEKTNNLKVYFPMIRQREEILAEISGREDLKSVYTGWSEEQRDLFLDSCTGVRGVKMLYDSFFKAIFNPDATPERLEELLSLILRQEVQILNVLPNEGTRIGAENTLLIMDIVVKLADGSIANVECQKAGYAFPGQRAACYSADLLMRQYKRVRGERGRAFSYRDIKKVYTIIFYERSPREFHAFREYYIHRSRQRSDSGIELELLQEFIFLPLDVFFGFHHNKGIGNKLEAWLTFLGSDRPEAILDLIEKYPYFKKLYEEVYELCRDTGKVMGMFSKELQELDKNTVQYMIDEMQNEIDDQKVVIDDQKVVIDDQKVVIDDQKTVIDNQSEQLKDKETTIKDQKSMIEEQKSMIEDQAELLMSRDAELERLRKRIAELEQ